MISLSASASIHSNVPQDVEKYAASEGLEFAKKMLSLEPAGMVELNVKEIGQLTLGPGLQQHVIDWEKLRKTDASSMLSVIKPIQEWEFILEKDGKPITAMIVKKDQGKLRVSRIGGPADNFLQAWNTFDAGTNAAEPLLVVDMNVRYLVGKHKEQEVAVPDLTQDRADVLNNMTNQKIWPASDLTKALKDQVEAAIAQNQSNLAGGSGGASMQLPDEKNNFSFILACAAGLLGVCGIGVYLVRKKANK